MTVVVGPSGPGSVVPGPVVVVAVVEGAVVVVVEEGAVVVGAKDVDVVDVVLVDVVLVDVVLVDVVLVDVVVEVGFPTAPALPIVPIVDTGTAGAITNVMPNTISASGPIKVTTDRPSVVCDIDVSFVTHPVCSRRAG